MESKSSYGTNTGNTRDQSHHNAGLLNLKEVNGPDPCISPNDDDYLLQKEKHLTCHLAKRWRNTALGLSCISIVFTLVIGLTALSISSKARSSAAFGFAFDSLLDVITTVIVIWRFLGEKGEFYSWDREQRACKIIAVCFIVSGLGIFVRGLRVLVVHRHPHEFGGVQIISGLSLVVYSILSWSKLVIADKISSSSLKTDGYNSLAGATLSLGMLMSSLAYGWDKSVWFLDASIALCTSLAIGIYGISLLSQMMMKPGHTNSDSDD